jgi:hypothetical protein
MRAGIPPRVTSKKTIGFPSVASAMVVAVQCLAAAGVVRILQGQMTLMLAVFAGDGCLDQVIWSTAEASEWSAAKMTKGVDWTGTRDLLQLVACAK